MRKIFTKIVCFSAATATAFGIFFVSACTNTRGGKPLTGDFSKGEVKSNGGFAVEKGDYVYYVNGKEANTADNSFGTPVKGALMRIAKDDLSAHSYNKADIVVPEIVYSGNNNSGIYVYDDYVYYATPSTEKNSDGEVLNSHLAFKRAKLDGTESMKDYFVQYSDNTIEYRYVKGENGKIYLVYVAKSENLYGTAYTNLHSVNIETGENTLLAYNVDAVMFDETKLENPRIYYTMKVTDFVLNSTSSNYNQIWTVTADTTTAPKEYNFDDVKDYDAEKDPLYVNLGTLVYDGIGKIEGMTNSITQFNAPDAVEVDRSAYTYTLSKYTNDTLFYTRTSSQNSTAMLFAAKEADTVKNPQHKAAMGNPENADCLLRDGSNASTFTYLFDGDKLTGALIASSDGLLRAKISSDGKFTDKADNLNTYAVTSGAQPTLLFTAKHGDKNYVYYSVSGGNGYTVNRISYDGEYSDYAKLPEDGADEINAYTSVRVLDLDASSDWYKPEFIGGQILFASETSNMTDYDAIMVCDLRLNGEVMDNVQLDKYNEMYEDVAERINKTDDEVYENLKNALWYAYYTNDGEYLGELNKAYMDIKGYKEEHFWSKESVELFGNFVANKGDWAADAEKTKPFATERDFNEGKISTNKRDYYYSILGFMNETDAKAYDELLKTTYLQPYPEKDPTWFESLSTGAKAGFLIGVIGGGLLIIAAAVLIPLLLKRRQKKLPVYKKRIKVDTTDDKNINVYETEDDNRSEE